MNSRDAIKLGLDMAQMCCNMYLDDMTDEQLMLRPTEGCNHTNWQLGHLICSDNNLVNAIAAGRMPALPAGFADRYTKETASSDDASAFCTKAELLAAAAEQWAGVAAVLAEMSDQDLDAPTPEPVNTYAPTAGAVFSMLGSHWMMHSGQWVVVRRQLGRPPLF